MAFAGLILIGLLFGVLLSATVIGFIVVRSGGPIKESLFGGGDGRLVIGRPPPATALSIEADNRCKALAEDLRIAQKLLDQNRVERVEAATAAQAAAAEIGALKAEVVERDARIAALETAAREANARIEELFTQLSDRTQELAKVGLQLKDARTELDVVESGSTVTSVQIRQLQRERDELAELVESLRSGPVASRPFA